MATHQTKPVQVTAQRWIDKTSLPALVGPYIVPMNGDDEQEVYVCDICSNAYAIHGVLLTFAVGRLVCPNSWIVDLPGGGHEVLRNRAFNIKYVAL